MREGYHTSAQPGATKAQLTRREREVVQLLGQGLRLVDIADRLVITPTTVHTHVASIKAKTGITATVLIGVAAAKGEL